MKNFYTKLTAFLLLLNSNAFAYLDSHIHVMSWKDDVVEESIDALKNEGTSEAWVISWSYLANVRNQYRVLDRSPEPMGFDEFVRQENDYIIELQNRHPDFVRGFCSVPWGYDKVEEEYRRCHAAGIKGVKVYPVEFFPYQHVLSKKYPSFLTERDGDFMNHVFTLALELDFVVGIHSNQLSDADLNWLYWDGAHIRDFTTGEFAKIILWHGFGRRGYERLGELGAYLRTYGPYGLKDNFYVELSGIHYEFYNGDPLIDTYIQTLSFLGFHQILFGSDTFLTGAEDTRKNVRKAKEQYLRFVTQDQMNLVLKNRPFQGHW